MVTRKDLMIFKLVDQKHRELENVKKLQSRVRAMLKSNGFYDRNPKSTETRHLSLSRRLTGH